MNIKALYLALIISLLSSYNFAQDLYDIDNITQIEIEFDDPNWDQTLDTYMANDLDEMLIGTCTINGTFLDSVGVKYKGNSTYSANNGKNPLNISLDYIINQDYQGYQTLKLSNGKNDPSFVREPLSYEIVRKYMNAPLSNYAQVYINGSYYGLFTSSEAINNDFQQKHLNAGKNNTRVKCNPENTFDGGSSLKYLGTDTTSYYADYDLKSDFGWEDLADLCDTIVNYPAEIEKIMDIDRAIWMMALNNVMVNLDSYIGPFRQNYYLIRDNNERFASVIWDLNECLGGFEMIDLPQGGPPAPTSSTDLIELDLLLREGDTDWPLLKLILGNSSYKKMYIAHSKTILEENFSNSWYMTRAYELQTICTDAVNNDPNAFYTNTEFTTNISSSTGSGQGATIGITELMDDRVTYLESTTEFTATQPTISNITSSNTAPTPYETITMTASITDANYVYLGYRNVSTDIFTKVEMFDDGAHNDGAANDGVYGADVTLEASSLQYYIYAENNNVGMFSPERAEYEFHELAVVSADIVINEVLASNSATIADQNSEYNDWIELYNNSSSEISLNGYYLSDNAELLTKWQFPDTSIAANGYLIIWADNDTTQSGLHTNYKLSATSDELLLSSPAQQIIDRIDFSNQQTDIAFGRYPNGTGTFTALTPTYAAENALWTAVEEIFITPSDILIYPNPASNFITIEGAENTQILIYNAVGQLVVNTTGAISSKISTNDWENGLYFIQTGNTVKKLIVNH